MQISSRISNGTLFILLSGELDEYNAGKSRNIVDNLIDDNSYVDKVIFNLEEVKFMDSTGIGFLIGRYKRLKRLGIAMFLQNPNFCADKVLSISGIYSLISKI